MRKHLVKALVLFGILAVATQAQALPIAPGDALVFGNENNQPQINAVIASYLGSAEELYKAEVGDGEEGPLASSYETTFSNTVSDPSDALIEWIVGEPIVGDPAFLLVKDGHQTPAWYLFALTVLGWNGTDDLELSGFWPSQGAISHVALYGTPVPEPGTMLLLGSGLIGLSGWGRKKFRR